MAMEFMGCVQKVWKHDWVLFTVGITPKCVNS